MPSIATNKCTSFAARRSEKIWIKVSDQGQGFNPEAVPDCTDPEHHRVPNGRGIMLMRNFMSRVEYNEKGNVVEMEKVRGQDPPCCGADRNGCESRRGVHDFFAGSLASF